MSTNFPANLDTTAELGPVFINDSAVTDNSRQIDGDLRTNLNDATFAIQARIGVTNNRHVSHRSALRFYPGKMTPAFLTISPLSCKSR